MSQKQSSNSMVLVGIVLGIIGLLLSAVPIINNFAAILGLLAALFGVIGVVSAKKSGNKPGKAVAATILGIVTIVVVIASQAMYSDAINKVSDSFDRATGGQTEDVLKTAVAVEIGQFSAVGGEYGTDTLLPVTITNKRDKQASFSIKIEAVDVSGARIAEDTLYANDLNAKQSQKLEAFKFVESTKVDALKSATFKIASASES